MSEEPQAILYASAARLCDSLADAIRRGNQERWNDYKPAEPWAIEIPSTGRVIQGAELVAMLDADDQQRRAVDQAEAGQRRYTVTLAPPDVADLNADAEPVPVWVHTERATIAIKSTEQSARDEVERLVRSGVRRDRLSIAADG